mmetsp:Transcript_10079/g.26114  ORF Transcript_10079/g.26114 Transcript_10079/m.26114 type:complete len:584 (-) Transcript_10079:424-2175(-)
MMRAEDDDGEGGGAARAAAADKPERRLFKPLTVAFLSSYPVLLIAALAWRWQFGVVMLLLVLPPKLLLMQWWRASSHVCPLEHVLSSFGQGFWVLATLAVATGLPFYHFTQGVSQVVLYLLGFSPIYVYLFSMLAGFGAFILVEELWKLNFARWAMYKRQHRLGGSSAKGFVVAAVSTSLGHACAISALLSLVVSWTMVRMAEMARAQAEAYGDGVYVADTPSDIELEWLIWWAFVFAGVSMPLNVVCSYEVALRLSLLTPAQLRIERGLRPSDARSPTLCAPAELVRIVAWPAVGRTLFAAQVPLWLMALPPAGASALIVISGGALYAAMVMRVRALEGSMPRMREGELQRFGFALLSDEADPPPDNTDNTDTDLEAAPAPAAARTAVSGSVELQPVSPAALPDAQLAEVEGAAEAPGAPGAPPSAVLAAGRERVPLPVATPASASASAEAVGAEAASPPVASASPAPREHADSPRALGDVPASGPESARSSPVHPTAEPASPASANGAVARASAAASPHSAEAAAEAAEREADGPSSVGLLEEPPALPTYADAAAHSTSTSTEGAAQAQAQASLDGAPAVA